MFKKLKDIIRLLFVRKKASWGILKCRLCGATIYPKEKYYEIDRWYKDKRIIKMCYCLDCVKSKREVLNEVDTDSLLYGLARIDSYNNFKKKDYTRYKIRKSIEVQQAKK